MMGRTERTNAGFTLVELVVVVVVMATLLGVAVLGAESITDEGRKTATLTSMRAVRDAIVGTGSNVATGRAFWRDLGRLPRNTCTRPYLPGNPNPPTVADQRWSLAELVEIGSPMAVYDPIGGLGWRGPYVTAPRASFGALLTEAGTVPPAWAPYGLAADWAVADGFQNPLVLQVPDFESGPDTLEEVRHARLVSAGGDGVLSTPANAAFPAFAACGDDLVVYLFVADLRR
jgi:prepilin-type N-terminal cleavage/methylation domain-containing protein